MSDAELGPKVMEKGKIHFFPKNIKGSHKVAEIFRKFQEKSEKHG